MCSYPAKVIFRGRGLSLASLGGAERRVLNWRWCVEVVSPGPLARCSWALKGLALCLLLTWLPFEGSLASKSFLGPWNTISAKPTLLPGSGAPSAQGPLGASPL